MKSALAGSLLLLALVCGCCSAACRPENFPKTAARETPNDAALFFQYLLRNGCSSEAYQCLSRATRSEVPEYKWRLFGPWVEMPGSDSTIYDVLREAKIFSVLPHTKTLATVFIEHQDFTEGVQEVLFVKEDGKWQVGLVESYRQGYFN